MITKKTRTGRGTRISARVIETAITKLLDGGGSATDALLLRYMLPLSVPPPEVTAMIEHPEVGVRYDSDGERFVLIDAQGEVVADCRIGLCPLGAIYPRLLAAYEATGEHNTYQFAQWVLREPETPEHAQVKVALLQLFTMGRITVASWDDVQQEPRWRAMGSTPAGPPAR